MSEEIPQDYSNQEQENPYKEPPLEKIFTYKDEQREIKMAERQKNAKLEIWEKSKPKNAGMIRRINEIGKEEEKKKEKHEVAEEALPGEHRKRLDSKHDLIEKKRDMFLLQMMLDLKKKEIQKMDDFKKLREQGLDYSEKMMEEDLQNVKRVVNTMKDECSQTINNSEAKAKENQRKETELKKIKEEMSSLHNKISKDTDTLENGFKYMEFFLRLQAKESTEEPENTEEKKDSQVVSNVNNKLTKKGTLTESGAGGQEDILATLSLRPELIDLINDPSNDYPLQFSKPEELYSVFLNLEEQNMNLIKRKQELDEAIEALDIQFKNMKSSKEGDIDSLIKIKEKLTKNIKEQNEILHNVSGEKGDQDPLENEEQWLDSILKTLRSFSMFSGSKSNDSLLLLGNVEDKLNEIIKQHKEHKDPNIPKDNMKEYEQQVKGLIQGAKMAAKELEEKKTKDKKVEENEQRFLTAQKRVKRGKETMRPTRHEVKKQEAKKEEKKVSDSFDEAYFDPPIQPNF